MKIKLFINVRFGLPNRLEQVCNVFDDNKTLSSIVQFYRTICCTSLCLRFVYVKSLKVVKVSVLVKVVQ